MKLHFRNELFDIQLLRTMSYTYYNGAEIGECLTTAERIRETDTESWYLEWMKTADQCYRAADQCLHTSQLISAREAFLRASNYYRTACIFLLKKPADNRLLDGYSRHSTAFKKAAELFTPAFEFIQIPYEDTYLAAYFSKADNSKRPLLILTGGYDSTMEESYFFNVQAALNRGYHCLCFDGPGQGELLIRRQIPFRHDWENVVKWVVDYALTRKEVDEEKIVLMGLSFGGYLAPRAASMEKRIAACIADPGQYDMFDAILKRIPGILKSFLNSKNPVKKRIIKMIFDSMLKHPVKGWALRRGLLVHGVSSVDEYFNLMKNYTLKGYADKITCPMLVCDAENDEIAAFAGQLFEQLACEKEYVRFLNKDGAGLHCELGNRALFHEKIFTWLDTIFKVDNGEI